MTEQEEKAATAYATKVVNGPEEADENTLLLVVEDASDEALAALCQEVGTRRLERLFVSDNSLARAKGLDKWYIVTFDGPKNPQLMAQKFSLLPSVSHVQYNTKVYRNFVNEGTPYTYSPKGFGDFNIPFNDPLLSDQWHYINNCDLSVAETSRQGADINVKDAWRLCAGDPDIIVAICDEGVKYNHPDLIENMWVNEDEIPGNEIDDDNNGYVDDIHGWNFLSTEEYPKVIDWTDKGDKGHGTHVAGTVAAVNNNGIGVGGVAGGSGKGDGVKMMSCQVFSGNSSATIAARAKAYEYAANNGACIIQCSYGLLNNPDIGADQFLPRQRKTTVSDILTHTQTAERCKHSLEIERRYTHLLCNLYDLQFLRQMFFNIKQCFLNVNPPIFHAIPSSARDSIITEGDCPDFLCQISKKRTTRWVVLAVSV